LGLATVPAFVTRWTGIAAIYLETNEMSTVHDPSGTVLVDVPPPDSPDTPQRPLNPSIAAENSPVQALVDVTREQSGLSPVSVSNIDIFFYEASTIMVRRHARDGSNDCLGY